MLARDQKMVERNDLATALARRDLYPDYTVAGGYFKATVHRVISPPAGAERISVAYFFNPKLEATLVPIDLPQALAAEARGGESADPSNPILANYGENSLKVRLRAHPDVAAIHHPDLL